MSGIAGPLASAAKTGVKATFFPIILFKDLLITKADPEDEWSRGVWTILLFFFVSSLLICVFAIGSVVTVFIAMFYAYMLIYKKIKCISSGTPDDKCNI